MSLLSLLALAHAEPEDVDRRGWLAIDPDAPPTRVASLPELGHGAVRVRMRQRGGLLEMDAYGAAVITLRPGAAIPPGLSDEGVPLGRSRRSWSVPAGPDEDALDVAVRWARDPAVSSALPDLQLHHTRFVEFDDPDLGAQWYLELLSFDRMAERTLGDPTVRVAVIDGGIDIGHPDLAASVVEPYDAVDDDDDPRPDDGEGCPEGQTGLCEDHGTSSAGIILARSNNGIDLVGLCSECSMIPIRLLGPTSRLSTDVASFEHAIDADAAVINNSWGFTEPIAVPAALGEVIERALVEPRGGLGAVVVFAAGNDDRQLRPDEMTGIPGVLTVSATDRYGFPTNYTNVGSTVDLAAPSATVSLAAGGGLNTTFGGTSAAAPVASGVAAWLLSLEPGMSSAEATQLLIDTARPVNGVEGHDPSFGYGYLDPGRILDALEGPADTGDAEERRACGCQAVPASWLGALPVGGLAVLPMLLGLARRR
ncbi:MAG: S8 family serine peptidase [Myxococcota bacterium]